MRDCERICRYLHVPAQSGSDRILKLMNRGYTRQQYRDFIDRARAMMPDICIASDFIVGFPTETDEDFQPTVDLVPLCRFKNSFIFKYSPRPGHDRHRPVRRRCARRREAPAEQRTAGRAAGSLRREQSPDDRQDGAR